MQILNDDVLGIIFTLTNNYYCALVCKDFYHLIKNNAVICSTCHKFTSIYGHVQWITDETDIYDNKIICHGYYKNIEYYTMIKRMLTLYPKFFKSIDRQCFALCLHAIQSNPLMIKYVKDQSLLTSIAINKNPKCIKYVNQTPLLCDMVIEKNPENIKYIQNPSYKMYLKVVQAKGQLLQYVPYEHQTPFVCDQAIKNDIEAFKFVAEQYQSHTMCLYVLSKNYQMIHYIKNPKEEYYVEIYKSHPHYLNTLFASANTIGYIGANNYLSSKNTALGHQALKLCTQNNNIGIGYKGGSNILKSDNIMIGNTGLVKDEKVIRLGHKQTKNYQAGIYGTKVKGVPVYISPDGQLGI